MFLTKVKISNYRSIDVIEFNIFPLNDGSCTYGLIGVNEAGKSTFLKALALKEGLKDSRGRQLPLNIDFRDRSKPIEVIYYYDLSIAEVSEIMTLLTNVSNIGTISNDYFNSIIISVSFSYGAPSEIKIELNLVNIPDENPHKTEIQKALFGHIYSNSHKTIFWTAEDRYLISQPVNLNQFATDPESTSIPLKNCFALAGISGTEQIKIALSSINDSTEREHLQNRLGETVTQHINKAWPQHKIKITFNVSDGLINFHVHDSDIPVKAKTADQRSDGFRQFISFLLTVSAQRENNELTKTILLLDEPETHLHPQAQEELLKELIKISEFEKQNIVFFATHSNYMIDKVNLGRNYKVQKIKDMTNVAPLPQKTSSYSEVTYEVFDICSTDYHNELYSRLNEIYISGNIGGKDTNKQQNFDDDFFRDDKKLKQDKPFKKTPNKVTLPTYVRNCIHHPEGGNKYSPIELKRSINLMRSYLSS